MSAENQIKELTLKEWDLHRQEKKKGSGGG